MTKLERNALLQQIAELEFELEDCQEDNGQEFDKRYTRQRRGRWPLRNIKSGQLNYLRWTN